MSTSPAPQPADGERCSPGMCQGRPAWDANACAEANGCHEMAAVHMDADAPKSTHRALDALVVAARKDSATPASAEPTEAHVQFARTFLDRVDSMNDDEIVIDIAQALASQRAEIVARYEAVADQIDQRSDEWGDGFHESADRIREAAPK